MVDEVIRPGKKGLDRGSLVFIHDTNLLGTSPKLLGSLNTISVPSEVFVL